MKTTYCIASCESALERLIFVKHKFHNDIISFIWIIWMCRLYILACHRWFKMDFFVIVYLGSETWVHLVGCSQNSSYCQPLGYRNTKYWSPKSDMAYHKQKVFIVNVEEKLTKWGTTPLRYGDLTILNLCRESEGQIHSFKLSRENIKHRPFWHLPLGFDFVYKRPRFRLNIWKINTIFWRTGSCDMEYTHTYQYCCTNSINFQTFKFKHFKWWFRRWSWDSLKRHKRAIHIDIYGICLVLLINKYTCSK